MSFSEFFFQYFRVLDTFLFFLVFFLHQPTPSLISLFPISFFTSAGFILSLFVVSLIFSCVTTIVYLLYDWWFLLYLKYLMVVSWNWTLEVKSENVPLTSPPCYTTTCVGPMVNFLFNLPSLISALQGAIFFQISIHMVCTKQKSLISIGILA